MDLHSCIVKLRSGDRTNGVFASEVAKHNVTTPEVILLQYLHGEDAIVGVKVTGVDKGRKDLAERDRLAGLYRPEHVKKLFGESFQPLPRKLPEQRVAVEVDDMAA